MITSAHVICCHLDSGKTPKPPEAGWSHMTILMGCEEANVSLWVGVNQEPCALPTFSFTHAVAIEAMR